MADSFDVIVIGGGPGGYVAAIRSAQLGKRTAVVEKDKPGGRCLNYACIPAKTMLYTAELYDHALNGAELGVKVEGASLDWEALGTRRAKVSDTLAGGVKMLWDKNKVEMIEGEGGLTAEGNVKVGRTTYEAGAVVLATGSVAMPIPGAEFKGRVVDTWGAWSLPEQPKTLAVVGAGASGAEIASAYGRFGTDVILIEMLDQILPAEDKDMAKVVERAFKKQNITISTGTPVESVEAGKSSVKVSYGGQEAEVEYLCIAGGRAPDTGPLNLGDAGVETEEAGRLKVDEYQRTSNPKVYAIGDLVRGPALAHKASEEGVVAVETIAGQPTHPINVEQIPGATFCHPQVASVGMTEAQAKEAGRDVKVGRFKLGAIGAGTVYDDREGMVKIVADKEYGEIVGAHIVGNRACDMISELVDTMALEGGYQELARIVHPHPTISEAILDAARAVDGSGNAPVAASPPGERPDVSVAKLLSYGVVSERPDPYVLPPDLPVPEDDGAADHLMGMAAPAIALPSTTGPELDLAAEAAGTLVLYVYPRTGRPGHSLPPHWNEIPGARGCTPQACAFRDRFGELRALGARVLGLSAQALGDQLEFAKRVGLPYPLLSDPGLVLGAALDLPTFTVAHMRLYRRLTLVFHEGRVAGVFYPVFPPDENAAEVIAWLSEARLS